jgi:hypothetical protein
MYVPSNGEEDNRMWGRLTCRKLLERSQEHANPRMNTQARRQAGQHKEGTIAVRVGGLFARPRVFLKKHAWPGRACLMMCLNYVFRAHCSERTAVWARLVLWMAFHDRATR